MYKLRQILFKPFQKFIQLQASGSILLLLAAIVALVFANSPWGTLYEEFWHTTFSIGVGPVLFRESLHFLINDGLMAIFFLVVGLEIKRELLVGELSSRRQAMLPIVAALGGMLVPALIYLGFNPPGSNYAMGWGIPTVTDIAFAIGVMTVLGNRVPVGLKVFLIALAIVDDLGAIVLIALFYSQGLNLMFLLLALLVLVLLFITNRMRIENPLAYALLGFLLWACILNSGLHATLAGVLLAFAIPSRSQIDANAFYGQGQSILQRFQRAGLSQGNSLMLTNAEHQASVQELESLCENVQSPLQKMEHALHPWVTFLILPLFALANAGVHIPTTGLVEALSSSVTLGIVFGLFFGKQIGITLFAWLAVKLKLAALPMGVRWTQIYSASILGGIGFTMSLFISLLAFQNPLEVTEAKIGILLASLLAGVVGTLVLAATLRDSGESVSDSSSI